jgi:chromosome segregation ATPase
VLALSCVCRHIFLVMQERILALTTRRDLSRQALAGLQAKMGHTAAGIVGALMAVKEHLRSEGHTDVDEKFSLAFRIADLEALQLSLIEKENNELRELYGEVSELHDLTLRQNVTDQSAHDEFAHKQHIASLTMQLEEQKIRVAELQNSLTVANEVGSSKSDLAQAEAIESLNIRLKDQSEELRLKTSALDEAKVRLADLLQSLTTVQQDKEIALKKIEDLLHRVEDLEVMVGGDAAAQTQIAALNQQVAELTRNLSTAQRDRDILRGEKELAEMGSRQAHDKVSAKLIGENEREHWQTQVARLNQDMSHLQNELDHSRAQSQSLQSALDQLRTKAQSLRGDLDQSWTRERNLQNSLVEAEKRIKELEQAVISQRHQLDQTNEQSQGHVREQTRIVQEIDRLTGYVEEQKRELDHWRSKSAGLQRINDRENKPQNNQVDAMTQLQRELDGQMARVSELTQNLVNVSRDQAALSATLRQVTGERDHLQREVVRFTGELEMAEQVGVKAREEVVMLAKAVKGKEAAMKKVDTLTLELEELRLGNSKLQDRHAQDLASLRKEHQGSQQELVELRTLNAQQKDAHDNLMAKLQDEKNERQMLEETMQTLERAVHDLEVQQVALRKERDQISDERDRQSQEISRTQARLSEIDELRMVTEVTSKELVETKGRAASGMLPVVRRVCLLLPVILSFVAKNTEHAYVGEHH